MPFIRFFVWIWILTFFTISANTGSESLKKVGLNLSQRVTCFTEKKLEKIEIISPLSHQKAQVKIYDLLSEAPPLVREMICERVDDHLYCDWTAFKGLQVELSHVWQEQDALTPSQLHVRGLWLKGMNQKPEPIFCHQPSEDEFQ